MKKKQPNSINGRRSMLLILHTLYKSISICLLILLSCELNAQDWGSNSPKWHYTRSFILGQGFDISTIETLGDTIIDGQAAYHMFVQNSGGCTNVYGSFFMFENNNKIFAKIFENKGFEMLYNFNAQVGDHWSISISSSNDVDSLEYRVINTELIPINNELRRKLTCEYHFNTFWEYNASTTILIEGIGDLNTFFPWNSPVCDDSSVMGLRCYENDDIGLVQFDNQLSCDIETNTNDFTELEEVKIFPNPSTNILFVEGLENENFKIEVFDTIGQKKMTTNDPKIDVSILDNGIYYLHISTTEGQQIVRKVIKTE